MNRIIVALIVGWGYLSLLSVSGCVKEAKEIRPKIIATVNGEPITARDLKRELALRARQDPTFQVTPQTLEEQLALMIDQRLLLQEAMRRNLPERERFVNTIRNFWEQTLIMELTDEMTSELKDELFVTEEEIQDFYKQSGDEVTFQIIRADNRASIEQWLEQVKRGESISWEKELGPIGYGELPSGALLEAFRLDEGEVKVFQEGRFFYLVRLSEKRPRSQPPLDQLRDQIRTQIKQRKQKKAFDQWLDEARALAKIKIYHRDEETKLLH